MATSGKQRKRQQLNGLLTELDEYRVHLRDIQAEWLKEKGLLSEDHKLDKLLDDLRSSAFQLHKSGEKSNPFTCPIVKS